MLAALRHTLVRTSGDGAPRRAPWRQPRQCCTRRTGTGIVLVEWLVGVGLGLMVVTAALALFVQQIGTLRDLAYRQRQAQEVQSLVELLRREVRRAGLRLTFGPSAEHDMPVIESSARETLLHYRADGDVARAIGRSTFRVSQQALQWRSPATVSFQGLHDTRTVSWLTWSARLEEGSGCRRFVTMELKPILTNLSAGDTPAAPIAITARVRNHGLTTCEMP